MSSLPHLLPSNHRTGHPGARLVLFAFLGLVGCDATKSEAFDPTKSDVAAPNPEMRGRLSFGGEGVGEFLVEEQQDGYIVTARAGAVLTLDNTNRGTTRSLDSTLVIYGPRNEAGSYGDTALAFDDDSGWGAHAKISEFEVPADGEYLVILSTFAGADRGRYRLELSCEGDACIIPCDEACAASEPCSGQTCSEVDGCIRQELEPICSDISIDATELVTSADGGSDQFTVRLQKIPEDDVIIRLVSSDIDQASVYPQKISFCQPGFVEGSNGCEEAEPGDDTESWSQVVSVTVTGARSLEPDGDVPFSIEMSVETADPHYAGIALEALSGSNLGDAPAPTLDELAGLEDEALLLALHERISDHRGYGYLGQNSARNIMFSAVDVHDGLVEGLYSGATIERPWDSVQAFMAGFNSEHTWPQGQFDEVEPARSDLHHVFPATIEANGLRSSFDFGITDPEATGSRVGESVFGAGTVYQVRPERRGDVARAHFYLVARYGNDSTLGIDFDDDSNPSNGRIKDSEEAILRAWHAEDPVDDLERIRNNRIEAFQGNRNPFVDRPELVDAISDF